MRFYTDTYVCIDGENVVNLTVIKVHKKNEFIAQKLLFQPFMCADILLKIVITQKIFKNRSGMILSIVS